MIAGTYQHVKNEGLVDFIVSLGQNADFAGKADAAKTTLQISQSGDIITIKTIHPNKEEVITFSPGKEFDDPLPNGEILKSVANVSGNTISVKSKKNGADVGGRVYEFSADGVVITMTSAASKVAKRHFKRA